MRLAILFSSCSVLLACSGASSPPNNPAKDKSTVRPTEDPCASLAATAQQTNTARAHWDAALCHERAGRLLDAFGDANRANLAGIEAKDDAFIREISEKTGDIMSRIPKVQLVSSAGTEYVQFDGRRVQPNSIFYVNQGEHRVVAIGTTSDGRQGRFEQTLRAEERTTTTVTIEPR